MGIGGKQWSAALVTCAGDQWSLIFLERHRWHFLGGVKIADPGAGCLSGSNKQGFCAWIPQQFCPAELQHGGVETIIKPQLIDRNQGFILLCYSAAKIFY